MRPLTLIDLYCSAFLIALSALSIYVLNVVLLPSSSSPSAASPAASIGFFLATILVFVLVASLMALFSAVRFFLSSSSTSESKLAHAGKFRTSGYDIICSIELECRCCTSRILRLPDIACSMACRSSCLIT